MQGSLSDQFKQSYRDHPNYPCNLIPKNIKAYSWELEQLKKRFQDSCPELCLGDDGEIDLPIRDTWTGQGCSNDPQACDIRDPTQLEEWLENRVGGQNSTAQDLPSRGLKCRFVYIYAQDSRAELRLTREMLTRVLSYHQVMPQYLDFLHAFGTQENARGNFFTGFDQQTILAGYTQPSQTSDNWRQYQLCYNLRGVTSKPRPNGKVDWSVRQAVFNHHFDVNSGIAVWTVTKGRKDLLERYDHLSTSSQRLSFETPQACFRASLEVHRMFCRWSAEDWRSYIDHMEDDFNSDTSMALYESQESKSFRKEYQPLDIQKIQLAKENTNQATMLLESNADVMTALREYYLKLLENGGFALRTDCRKDVQEFASEMEANIVCIKMQVRQLNLLAETINDRKSLVAQHFQNQVGDRTEQLNHNLEKEAIVMRIITIVTLIYLPATFVSTFFSTDVVHYQNSNASGADTTSYSHLAMMRWLQVTLPLTFVTILGAWMAFKTATISRKSLEMRDSLRDQKNKVTMKRNRGGDLEMQPLDKSTSPGS